MRAPQPRVAKDPRHIRPQTRVDAIKRGTSKRRRPPATIYPTDQDCRGHVEKIRRRASYLVRRKHDGSKDGWKRHNQGWLQVQIKSVPERWPKGRQFLEGNIRWGNKNWTSGFTKREERKIDISCKGVMIRPLAGSAHTSLSDMDSHEKIQMNAQIVCRCTDRQIDPH